MAFRNIRFEGDAVLRKISKPVPEVTKSIRTLLDDMADTMYRAKGVGLAAPQVGILKRVVVIDVGDGLIELINPEIIEERGSEITEEGCLSLPGEFAYVERPEYVKVKAKNRQFEDVIYEGEGLLARAFCHEIDHLDGILYIDKKIDESELEFEEDGEDA